MNTDQRNPSDTTMTGATRRTAPGFIRNCTKFRNSNGSLSGHRGYMGSGSLPAAHATESLFRSPYVVYSYETPIAWLDADTGLWVRPSVRYSQTTSCHQGLCPVDGSVQ